MVVVVVEQSNERVFFLRLIIHGFFVFGVLLAIKSYRRYSPIVGRTSDENDSQHCVSTFMTLVLLKINNMFISHESTAYFLSFFFGASYIFGGPIRKVPKNDKLKCVGMFRL